MAHIESFQTFAGHFEGELYFDLSQSRHNALLLAYSTDASVYQELPLAVAIPYSRKGLEKLIRFAQDNKYSLIPRTAGTSLAGQVVGNGIIVDVSKYFNKIVEINVEEQWVRVEPGVIRNDLNKELAKYGLMFGPETSTANRAMIGGMIGNNSSGLHSIVWGDTRANLLEAEVILDDNSTAIFEELDAAEYAAKQKLSNREGEIYRKIHSLVSDEKNKELIRKSFPKPDITRRNTGYALDFLIDREDDFNLCRLLAGSEGTLGFITEAKLKLMPLPPKEIGLLCVHFSDMVECMHGNKLALTHRPEASELVDKYIMDFTKDHPVYKHNRFFIEGDPEALLIIEFRGQTTEEIVQKGERLKQDLIENKLGYAYSWVTGDKTDQVWEVRKAGLGLIRNLPGEEQPVNLIEDCAVSPDDLPEYVTEVQALLKKEDVHASYYAHAGAGELHIEPFINLKTATGKQKFRRILEKTTDLVLKYNGSLSGEHGDGRLRGEFIPKVLGKEAYKLLEEVKQIFDPQGLFNPKKIVNTPPMDTHLRYEHEVKKPVQTIFDFSKEEGILRLAEKCSGSGDCRKTHLSGGTMCPSFMATRNEQDTTRARANLLRQFLTNSTQENKYDHKEILEVMDLCLSCKACKSECPSQVDVAKMKAEFLQHYYDANGSPFRSKVIAHFTQSQKLASYMAPLYNWVIQRKWTSSLVKSTIGFAKKRSLPKVYSPTLRKWIKQQKTLPKDRKVYLFCDEFTDYNDTPIGKKAYQLLTALGYEVWVPAHLESGRTFLSKGFVRKAKKIANKNIQLLGEIISDETPLIGIEPSAILTFRDEYLDLADKERSDTAKKLARNSYLIEEFLVNEWEKGNIRSEQFAALGKPVKLHGHCYQKAFDLQLFSEKLLKIIPESQVEIINSGCCGMAGSFGYEKEHFNVSMKVSELILLPEVRKNKDALIAAPGTSCRHQIRDGANRESYHPIEILYDALLQK
ncbi:MAG TPA: FAD-linked oxidase C-terminal domain-containing protein [Sphingobacterium sp.]|nr:FAD-linked oxidase C-terminal domain-containing protein [Sphingobacterium sp.]